jgi:hypothetical protein
MSTSQNYQRTMLSILTEPTIFYCLVTIIDLNNYDSVSHMA